MTEYRKTPIYVSGAREKKFMLQFVKVWNDFLEHNGHDVDDLRKTRIDALYFALMREFEETDITRHELRTLFAKAGFSFGTLYETAVREKINMTKKDFVRMKRQTIYLINTWFMNMKKYESYLDKLESILCVDCAPIFMFNKYGIGYDAAYSFTEQLKYLKNDDVMKLRQFVDEYCEKEMSEKLRMDMNKQIEELED